MIFCEETWVPSGFYLRHGGWRSPKLSRLVVDRTFNNFNKPFLRNLGLMH
jgi:hypothetical protein